MKADKDTSELLTVAEDIKEMLGTRGWKYFQKTLQDKIYELQMISNVTGESAEEKIRSMEVNQKTAEALYEIISGIVSTPAQTKANTEYLAIEEDTYFRE